MLRRSGSFPHLYAMSKWDLTYIQNMHTGLSSHTWKYSIWDCPHKFIGGWDKSTGATSQQLTMTGHVHRLFSALHWVTSHQNHDLRHGDSFHTKEIGRRSTQNILPTRPNCDTLTSTPVGIVLILVFSKAFTRVQNLYVSSCKELHIHTLLLFFSKENKHLLCRNAF